MQQISCDRQAEWLGLFIYLLTQYELNRSVLGKHAVYAAVSVSAGVSQTFSLLNFWGPCNLKNFSLKGFSKWWDINNSCSDLLFFSFILCFGQLIMS